MNFKTIHLLIFFKKNYLHIFVFFNFRALFKAREIFWCLLLAYFIHFTLTVGLGKITLRSYLFVYSKKEEAI